MGIKHGKVTAKPLKWGKIQHNENHVTVDRAAKQWGSGLRSIGCMAAEVCEPIWHRAIDDPAHCMDRHLARSSADGSRRQRGEVAGAEAAIQRPFPNRTRQLVLHQSHRSVRKCGEPNHEPLRESSCSHGGIETLVDGPTRRATTLVPLAIYFKHGRQKLKNRITIGAA